GFEGGDRPPSPESQAARTGPTALETGLSTADAESLLQRLVRGELQGRELFELTSDAAKRVFGEVELDTTHDQGPAMRPGGVAQRESVDANTANAADNADGASADAAADRADDAARSRGGGG
ncbi:MAG: hypothetical protein AAF772_20545, partial [Acidobacteriota bacterium]